MTKKVVYHVGDQVKIVEPQFFVRCGYPTTLSSAMKEFMTAEQRESLNQLMKSFGIRYNGKVHKELQKSLSYHLALKHGFGGNERQIYIQYLEEWKDKTLYVCDKRVVQTGIRVNGYTDEIESVPPRLSQIQQHVILVLSSYDSITNNYRMIEECWVEKVR